jgi:hypothetical protein
VFFSHLATSSFLEQILNFNSGSPNAPISLSTYCGCVTV